MTVTSLEDAVDSVRQNPEYGYNGKIYEIRKTEYPHLAGISYDHKLADD